MSLTPLLRGGTLPPRPIFWHYPQYHPGGATPCSVVLADGWRLVEFFEDDRAELFRLPDDPLEAHDLSAAEPEKTAELRGKLRTWRESVRAQLPTHNPDYNPAKPAEKAREKPIPGQ